MIKIVEAKTGNIPTIKAIAEKTWWHTYSSILTDKQLTYMLEAIYSDSALLELFENGLQTFIILYDDVEAKGFASFGLKKNEPAICKLHKLYVLPNNHGKGYGKMLIDEIKSRITNANIYTLDLNVNRFNPARSFYEKIGFKVIKEEDVPIGPYFMNDYVMRLEIAQ